MNYDQIKKNFYSELKNASIGKKSSLSFIKNPLSSKPLVKQGIVEAIVVGGTNYVSAIAKIDKRKYKILKTQKGKLPIFKTAEEFFSFLEHILEPKIGAIALNFAFPLKPAIGSEGELDGILIRVTKEHIFKGLIGKSVGDFVKKIYFEKFGKHVPVAVANDTVCLTLAGSGTEDGGLILGTGFNMSLKINEKGKSSVVNLEAGNFSGVEKTATLKIIDKRSEHKGKMLFEKSIAGKYLVTHFNEESKLHRLNISLKTSEDLSGLAMSSTKPGATLARSILERSAFLLASALAGAYDFRKRPSKFELITEGSLFWKGYKYKENVEKQLLQLGVPKNTIKFIEDSSLKGAIGLLVS